jgi:hypothetical protein
MDATEQKEEQTPDFTFKEVIPTEAQNDFSSTEIVEIKEEQPKEVEKLEEQKTEETVEQKQEVSEQETEEDQIYDLDEEIAFNHLKEKHGLEFDTFEDFIKSKEPKKIDPEFEKFQEYKEKTGRGYGDFLQTQKDWSKETPETIIKSVLKLENPELSNDDIDFLFDKDYAFDEEIDDDNEIRTKKIILKVDSKKALAVLEKQKEDYQVARGSDDNDVPEVYKEAKDLIDLLYDEQTENEEVSKTLRNDFVVKTQTVLNEKFDGFKFTIDGQDFKVKPEDVKQTRELQLDIANFQKKFFDKENKLADTEGYHKALYAAMNPEKLAQHFFNLGKTTYAEQLEKESKNIDVKGEKHIPNPALESFTFKKA